MTPSTGRSARWWEAALEAGLDGEPEEPWAEAEAAAEGTDLTDDQRAVLAGFDDQPAVPKLARLHDLAGDDEELSGG